MFSLFSLNTSLTACIGILVVVEEFVQTDIYFDTSLLECFDRTFKAFQQQNTDKIYYLLLTTGYHLVHLGLVPDEIIITVRRINGKGQDRYRFSVLVLAVKRLLEVLYQSAV